MTVYINPSTASGNIAPTEDPPMSATLDGTLDTCSALTKCANLQFDAPNAYLSFNLYYQISTASWICDVILSDNTKSDFNTYSSDVGRSFGYNAPEEDLR